MPRKTSEEKIAEKKEKMKNLAEEIKVEEQKVKVKKDKERTHRLCKRMGLFESMLPKIKELTDSQFETFLKRTVANEYGERELVKLLGNDTTNKPHDTTQQSNSNATKSQSQHQKPLPPRNSNDTQSHGGSVPTKG